MSIVVIRHLTQTREGQILHYTPFFLLPIHSWLYCRTVLFIQNLGVRSEWKQQAFTHLPCRFALSSTRVDAASDSLLTLDRVLHRRMMRTRANMHSTTMTGMTIERMRVVSSLLPFSEEVVVSGEGLALKAPAWRRYMGTNLVSVFSHKKKGTGPARISVYGIWQRMSDFVAILCKP